MSTTTLFPAAVAFLDQVRELLGDLTDEDREEVIQDLEAHLEDLGVTSIEQSLGTAEAFVDEFRASAGLSADSTKPRGRVSTLVDGVVDRWKASWEHPVIAQLNKLTEPLRPAWPWIRAWLALMLVAFGTAWDGVVFRRFPIPSVNGSAVTGLAALALVTWISVTAQRRGHRTRRLTGGILNLAAAIAILIGVFAPYALMTSWAANSYQHQDTVTGYGGLVGPYGDISNIHAYDRDGNPVEVLLYDQDGNPLTVSQDVYFIDVGQMGDSWGAVRFGTDAYGQPITNLFPLERLGEVWTNGTVSYDELPPPRVALPDLGVQRANTVPSTIVIPPVD